MRDSVVRASLGRRRALAAILAGGLLLGATACQGRVPTASSSHEIPTIRSGAVERVTPVARPVDIEFGRVVRLEAAKIDQDSLRAGESLQVWLHWLATGVAQEDLRSLGQVVGPNGRVVGKEDDQIGSRRNELRRWKVGDRHVDEMRIRIPPGAPPGEYGVVMAVLRPDNQTRVPITSPTDRLAPWSEDSVLLATIEIG